MHVEVLRHTIEQKERAEMTFSQLAMNKGLLTYTLILAFIIGSVFGSFINCLAWRLVHHEKITSGRSHCAVCHHTLGAIDLIPVFSYLFLKGRCRYCHQKISPRYFIVETVMGLLFVLCVCVQGLTWDTLITMAVMVIGMGLSLVDLDSYLIPDGFQLALLAVYVLKVLVSDDRGKVIKDGLIGLFVIGGGMLVLVLLMDRLLKKESMGGGDIKLLGIIGLYLGWMNGLLCLIVSCVVGLVMAGVGKKKQIPFGPSLMTGFVFCLLWGEKLIGMYLGLFGL
jgi:leader peptidase (prepilin peptidase)/N-methyltransferase